MELQFKYIAAAIVATMPLVCPGELDKLKNLLQFCF